MGSLPLESYPHSLTAWQLSSKTAGAAAVASQGPNLGLSEEHCHHILLEKSNRPDSKGDQAFPLGADLSHIYTRACNIGGHLWDTLPQLWPFSIYNFVYFI